MVSNGSREEMERDVAAMHGYGLWATCSRTNDRLVRDQRWRQSTSNLTESAGAPALCQRPERASWGLALGCLTSLWRAGGVHRRARHQKTDGPHARRLFPTAFSMIAKAAAEFRRFSQTPSPIESVRTPHGGELLSMTQHVDDQEGAPLLGALNDLRLMLGTRLA